MSLVISKDSLKEEGESLLCQLRDSLNQFKDIFRLNLSDSFFESIKKMKEDLNIAESVAIHEQLEREDKPLGGTIFWYHDYEEYTEDKSKDKKTRLVETAPSRFFKPDLESIARIFELVNIDMEFDEDLRYDVKNFLKKYKICQDMVSVSSLDGN